MLTVKQAQENIPQSEEASSLVKQLVDIEILYLLTFSPKSGYELKEATAELVQDQRELRNAVSTFAFSRKDWLHYW